MSEVGVRSEVGAPFPTSNRGLVPLHPGLGPQTLRRGTELNDSVFYSYSCVWRVHPAHPISLSRGPGVSLKPLTPNLLLPSPGAGRDLPKPFETGSKAVRECLVYEDPGNSGVDTVVRGGLPTEQWSVGPHCDRKVLSTGVFGVLPRNKPLPDASTSLEGNPTPTRSTPTGI